VPHFKCPKCGEQVLTFTQARRFEEDAIGLYRRKYHLLSSDEIRAVRERNRLTQAELAKLLRLGANTISRWEADRKLQTAALDVLLRLIRDLPGSVEYLRVQKLRFDSAFRPGRALYHR
jgi:putative zinc finger/helix-turn-helix YgiT family protein